MYTLTDDLAERTVIFDECIAQHKALVVKCSAVWCASCRVMEPIFDALEVAIPRAAFAELDLSSVIEYATTIGIRSVPTFLIIDPNDPNNPVALTTGASSSSDLQTWIEQNLPL